MTAWPPDPSTMLTFAFIVIALLALALILMFVHFHGGLTAVKADTAKLFHHAAIVPPTLTQPTISPAQLDAAIAKALAARGMPVQTPPF